MFLRALQARGLIRAQRHSRWVRYEPFPDPLVPGSRILLEALRRALLTEKCSDAVVRSTLTGFTHPRRLVILAFLREGRAVPMEEIVESTQISLPALSRHLSKLEARQLVSYAEQEWRLMTPPNHLAQTLLRLIQSDGQEELMPSETRKKVSTDVTEERKAAFEQPSDPSRKRKG